MTRSRTNKISKVVKIQFIYTDDDHGWETTKWLSIVGPNGCSSRSLGSGKKQGLTLHTDACREFIKTPWDCLERRLCGTSLSLRRFERESGCWWLMALKVMRLCKSCTSVLRPFFRCSIHKPNLFLVFFSLNLTISF